MDNHPGEITIKTIYEFILHVSEQYFNEQRGRWVFRGQSSSKFKLIPKISRISYTADTREKFEDDIFRQFKWCIR